MLIGPVLSLIMDQFIAGHHLAPMNPKPENYMAESYLVW